MRSVPTVLVSVLVLGCLAPPLRSARAAGCLVTAEAEKPLLQDREEILFVVDKGQITVHVKLRYSGRAGDFGWLLPLPGLPTDHTGMPGIDIGAEELFTQLDIMTRPTYATLQHACYSSGPAGCGASSSKFDYDPWKGQAVGMSSLVKQASVGPYDYAILKADDKSELLQWLSTHRYVMPAGTDAALNAYIRRGAYLLALRLTAGATLQDLQPVVLSYPGALPEIPITLTSVGSSPNMGIVVWILGPARAIPMSYAHVVVNQLQLDWLNQLKNYDDVVARAIAEAPDKHAFVTDYADSNYGRYPLDQPQRFGRVPALSTETDPVAFVQALLPLEMPGLGSPFGDPITYVRQGLALNGQFFAVVGAHVPMPQQLVAEGVSPEDYYRRIDHYLRTDRIQRPAAYADIEAKLAMFNPKLFVDDLNTRIIEPTLRAAKVFDSQTARYLTRLHTRLSPEDMNLDPVFGFNFSLPEVDNGHRALFDVGEDCYFGGAGRITLQDQDSLLFDRTYTQEEIDQKLYTPLALPYSQRIESLRQNGMPIVMVDNTAVIYNAIRSGEPAGACSTLVSRRSTGASYLALCGIALMSLLFRRRRAAASGQPLASSHCRESRQSTERSAATP